MKDADPVSQCRSCSGVKLSHVACNTLIKTWSPKACNIMSFWAFRKFLLEVVGRFLFDELLWPRNGSRRNPTSRDAPSPEMVCKARGSIVGIQAGRACMRSTLANPNKI